MEKPTFSQGLTRCPWQTSSIAASEVGSTHQDGPAPGTGEGEAMGNPMGKPWETYGFLLKSIGKPMVLLG